MIHQELRLCPAASDAPRNEPASLSVLLVEDSPAQRLRLATMVRRFGYRVSSVRNGVEALRAVADTRPDVVISDWEMPQMGGLELCRELQARHPSPPYFILITAKDHLDALVHGMDCGADDFLAKPFHSEEFRVRIQAGARLLRLRDALEQRNEEMLEALERETRSHQRLQQDLRAAATMQRELLPSGGCPVPGWEVATLFEPAAVVAGDWFNYFRLGPHHLAFYQLDVAGHGVPAAMLSFTLARFLTAGSDGHELLPDTDSAPTPPHALVAALNRRFQDLDNSGQYFTMVYGVIDLRDGSGQLCQAGHPYPLKVTAGGQVQPLGGGGFPVGVFASADFATTAFQLDPGEHLLIHSDGVSDCTAPDGRRLGTQTLADLLHHHHHRPAAELVAAIARRLHDWRGRSPVADDISVLSIRRAAAGRHA